ncbi:hypothetical protein EDB85DRAFT_2279520 [Lactarius pseudohatsudake]|nr:hypothetical protein EDB85DRAFT_2279520 [Lactarius pseudohatsudake]
MCRFDLWVVRKRPGRSPRDMVHVQIRGLGADFEPTPCSHPKGKPNPPVKGAQAPADSKKTPKPKVKPPKEPKSEGEQAGRDKGPEVKTEISSSLFFGATVQCLAPTSVWVLSVKNVNTGYESTRYPRRPTRLTYTVTLGNFQLVNVPRDTRHDPVAHLALRGDGLNRNNVYHGALMYYVQGIKVTVPLPEMTVKVKMAQLQFLWGKPRFWRALGVLVEASNRRPRPTKSLNPHGKKAGFG